MQFEDVIVVSKSIVSLWSDKKTPYLNELFLDAITQEHKTLLGFVPEHKILLVRHAGQSTALSPEWLESKHVDMEWQLIEVQSPPPKS